MLDLSRIEEKNGVSLRQQNVVINIISDLLEVELPSFEDIENFKKKGKDSISIRQKKENERNFLEIANEELNRLLKNSNSIGDSEKYKYRISTLYRILGEYTKEFKALKSIEEIEENPYLYNQLTQNILRSDIDKGINELKNKSDIDSMVNLTLANMQKRDFDEAEIVICDAYNKYGYDYKINITCALICIIQNNYKLAIQLLKEIAREDVIDDSICYLLALSYFLINNIKKSRKYTIIGLHLNRYSKDLLLLFSHICILNNDNDAVPYLEGFLEIKTDEIILERLARFRFHNGEFNKSRDLLNAMLAFNDQNPSVWNNLALTYQRIGDENKSLKFYAQALKYIEKNKDLIIIDNFLKFLFDLEKFDELISIYEELRLNEIDLSKLKDSYSIHDVYFKSLLKTNNVDLYIERLNELKSISKNNLIQISILNDLICLYSNMFFETEKMNQYADELLQYINDDISKDYMLALMNNIVYSKLESDHEIPADILQYFRSHLGENPYYNATYGLYYYKQKNITKGTEYYDKALSFSTTTNLKNKIKIKKNLEISKCYIQMNKISNAKTFLKKVIKNNELGNQYLVDYAKDLYKKIK